MNIRRVMGLFVAVLVCTACARSKTVLVNARRLLPATRYIAGVKAIALIGFEAYQEEEGGIIPDLEMAIRKTFLAAAPLRLIEADRSSPVHTRRQAWQERWELFGKRAGADAVFGGVVELAESRTLQATPTAAANEVIHGPAEKLSPGTSQKGLDARRPDEKGRSVLMMVREDFSRRGNEADGPFSEGPYEKEGVLVLTLHVLHTPSGKVIGGDRMIVRYRSKPADETRSLPSDVEVYSALVRDMAIAILHHLAPHPIDESIALIRTPSTASGLALAEQGEWAAAIAAWELAAHSSHRNHAAFYNLGKAYEFLESFDPAIARLQQALTMARKKRYRQALDEVVEKKRTQERHHAVSPSDGDLLLGDGE